VGRLHLTRREGLGLAGVVLAMLAITSAPYLYGILRSPPDKEFLGLIGQNGSDQAFYLGWGAKQAERGHVLFEDKYNGPTDRRLVFNLLWLAMGWSARLLGLPVLLVFQIERAAFSVLLLLAAYRIIRRFLPGSGRRLLALSLVAFGSGFGGFVAGWSSWGSKLGIRVMAPAIWTPDLWVVESNVFLTMLWEVVLPCATALFLLTIDSGYQTFFLERGAARRTGVLALVLGTVYPYAVISVYGILGGCALVRMVGGRPADRTLREYLTVVLVSLPIVVYDGLLVLTNPRLTTGQALYASPGPFAYFLAFGLVSVLAVPGALRLLRRRRPADVFLLAWILVTALQIYLPLRLVPFQMQLILGIQVPLVVVAVSGAAFLWRLAWRGRERARAPRRLAMPAAALLVLASTVTSAFHLQNVFVALERGQLPEYIDRKTREGIDWLAAHTSDHSLVLAAPDTAPYVPVLAGNRMYSGDYAAPTARFAAKERAIRWLFGREGGPGGPAVAAFLTANRIEYVFYDGKAQAMGGAAARARLEATPGVGRVFDNGAVQIYRFRSAVPSATPLQKAGR
jgi:hypothetical protein